MREVVEALMGRVRDEAEYPCYFSQVEETPKYPYVLLWTSAGGLDTTLLSDDRDLSDRLGVTMVATSGVGVLAMAGYVREALVGFVPSSDRWRVDAMRPPFDSREVTVDRDVALPGTGDPCFAVDLYDLTGTRR